MDNFQRMLVHRLADIFGYLCSLISYRLILNFIKKNVFGSLNDMLQSCYLDFLITLLEKEKTGT